MMRTLTLTAICGVTLAGCTMFAGKADYADYRTVRLAPDEPARLVAMQHYVQHHPDGHWHDEVQAARTQHDLATFEAGKATRAGLEGYLAAFPDGIFAAQARSRLSALELIEQRKREEIARGETLAAERKARQEELRRTWVTRFVGFWAKTLASLSAWGAPIPDVARDNPSFSRAFGAEPRPRCTADECVKYYSGSYAIPVPGGTRVERTISLVLRLRMRDGKLERAELLLPDRGFSRFSEVENRSMVVDSDEESRKAAVAWALDRLSGLLPELAASGPGQGAPMPEPGYVLAPIEKPSLGPTGELTDTAAEDPSAPPNRLNQDQDPSPAQQPSVQQLIAPNTEPAPDMVFNPVQVDRNGHAQAAPDLVMAPVAVPAPEAPAGPVTPPTVRAFRLRDLRVVFFAAGSDPGTPPYDGVLIERVAAETVRPKRH
jgi:hypothetical protein